MISVAKLFSSSENLHFILVVSLLPDDLATCWFSSKTVQERQKSYEDVNFLLLVVFHSYPNFCRLVNFLFLVL